MKNMKVKLIRIVRSLAFSFVCSLTLVGAAPLLTSGSLDLVRRVDAAEPTAPVVIRFESGIGEAEKAVFERLKESFEKQNPGIQVKIDAVPYDQFRPRLMSQFAGGVAPDVVNVGLEDFPSYVVKGMVRPLDGYMAKYGVRAGDFFPAAVQAYTVDGKLYALARDVAPLVVEYNTERFATNGIPNPTGDWNWDEFRRVAQKLTIDKNGDGQPEQWGLHASVLWNWPMLVWQAGGAIFDYSTKPPKFVLDSPEAVRGLQFGADLANRYKVVDFTGGSLDNGKDAMDVSGYWMKMERQANPSGLLWDVAEPPVGQQRATLAFIAAYAVTTQSRNPEAAFRWVNYITGVEGQMEAARLGLAIPARPQIARRVIPVSTPPENAIAYLKVLSYARPAAHYGYQSAWTVISQAADAIWGGSKAPETVVAEINKRVEQVLKLGLL